MSHLLSILFVWLHAAKTDIDKNMISCNIAVTCIYAIYNIVALILFHNILMLFAGFPFHVILFISVDISFFVLYLFYFSCHTVSTNKNLLLIYALNCQHFQNAWNFQLSFKWSWGVTKSFIYHIHLYMYT